VLSQTNAEKLHEIAVFHQFRDGKIVRDRIYLDRDEGLEAFALKE
jgi:ketosteroid isomerase-like protein